MIDSIVDFYRKYELKPTEFVVLVCMMEMQGHITYQRIIETTGLNQSTVIRYTNSLVDKCLVEKVLLGKKQFVFVMVNKKGGEKL